MSGNQSPDSSRTGRLQSSISGENRLFAPTLPKVCKKYSRILLENMRVKLSSKHFWRFSAHARAKSQFKPDGLNFNDD
jgi:hypothetical protein